MTNKEAIDILESMIGLHDGAHWKLRREALRMAVKALQKNEATCMNDEKMQDVIYRQAAIDEIKEIYEWHDNVTKERIIEHFERLPSAQPKDWMERNKERILQAGIEGREIEFRIGGRLFAIREKAQ